MELVNPDTTDLESLFDAAAEGRLTESSHGTAVAPAPLPSQGTGESAADAYDVFHRIGNITRKLHDALQQLGYDKQIEDAVHALPDARTRLDYIARLTGEAANKVLNTVDSAQQVQDNIDRSAAALRLKLAQTTTPEAVETIGFLDELEANAQIQRSNLTEIMMAQDFHDLTGQVIRKVVDLASGLEEQLVKLLLETTPLAQRNKVEGAWLNGPVVATAGRTDVVTNQAQVDDLLDSLGF